MKYAWLTILLAASCFAGTFTEFYCNATTGNNLNAGSTTGAPVLDVADMTWDGTSVFTVSAGTDLTPVTEGMFASVYDSSGADPAAAVYIARVASVDNGAHTVTLSTTAKMGTAPSAGSGGDRGMKVGGVWKGPNGTDGFPFTIFTYTLTDATGNVPRVNLKNNASYTQTAAITIAGTGTVLQGYTTTPGDGGKFLLTSSTASINQLYATATNVIKIHDAILESTATSGTGVLMYMNHTGLLTLRRVVARGAYGSCIVSLGTVYAMDFEAYNCSKGNAANSMALGGTAATYIHLYNGYIHNNPGSNVDAVRAGFIWVDDSILSENGRHGIAHLNLGAYPSYLFVNRSDFYSNGGSGIDIGSTTAMLMANIRNSNFFKNGVYGINGSGTISGAGNRLGEILNCMFGAGTQENTSGTTAGLAGITEHYYAAGAWTEGASLSYTADQTPWASPTTGDFRITGTANKNTGYGQVLQTDGTHTGTVAYPDIGAAQHVSSAATPSSFTFIAKNVMGSGTLLAGFIAAFGIIMLRSRI